ncbi:hypothetical protein QMN58_30795, partial [Escherichia coli]|nr:hypothetical protein [Escherichia coli]
MQHRHASGHAAVAKSALLYMTCPNATNSNWDNAAFVAHETNTPKVGPMSNFWGAIHYRDFVS